MLKSWSYFSAVGNKTKLTLGNYLLYFSFFQIWLIAKLFHVSHEVKAVEGEAISQSAKVRTLKNRE